MNKTLAKGKVIDDKILGIRLPDDKLYMIVWTRLANSGIKYCWATSEQEAFLAHGFNPEFVKHVIVEINPESLPQEIGVEQ